MKMKDKSYFFAVDLGATSGRTIIGTIENEDISHLSPLTSHLF